ncbi:MAG: trypsin-like peptidase domain-containing protein, partial [Paramuribaculum sp.]|nr:trypsin-like peptidase domain-containing protein [Paramuribaculum sp.]
MNIKKLSVIALMLAAVAASWYPVLAASGSTEEPATAPLAMAPTSMPDFTAAAESTINSVVSIKSFVTTPSYGYGGFGGMSDPFFDFFFGNGGGNAPRQQTPPNSGSEDNLRESGLGSGVISSADGYIITNNHVVDGAEKLEVTLNDTRGFAATVIGTDPNTDLALIKIDAADLPVLPWGDSDNLKIGEWVLAVGNPFGLTSTVTAGIVSAKARSISSPRNGKIALESFIQTDAAVNPGNSGGALVNLRGQLVGINSAIYSQTGSYSGYSFAIPTSIVKKIATDLKEYGTVQRALLGILYSELNAKIA